MESERRGRREDEVRARLARIAEEAIRAQGGDRHKLSAWTLGRIDHGKRVLAVLRRWGFCPDRGAKILDIGSGLGGDVLAFALGGFETVSVERGHNRHLVEIAAASDLPLRVVQADGIWLPFADASFDVTAAFQLIEHVREPRRLIGEMARVTKPAGVILITTPLRPWLTRFLPDPHYGIWGLALLSPEKQRRRVERKGLGPYEWTSLFEGVAGLRALGEGANLKLDVHVEEKGRHWLLRLLCLLFGRETGKALLPGGEALFWARR